MQFREHQPLKLLDGTQTAGNPPVRNKGDRLGLPLLVKGIDQELQRCGVGVVVFGRNDNESVCAWAMRFASATSTAVSSRS